MIAICRSGERDAALSLRASAIDDAPAEPAAGSLQIVPAS